MSRVFIVLISCLLLGQPGWAESTEEDQERSSWQLHWLLGNWEFDLSGEVTGTKRYTITEVQTGKMKSVAIGKDTDDGSDILVSLSLLVATNYFMADYKEVYSNMTTNIHYYFKYEEGKLVGSFDVFQVDSEGNVIKTQASGTMIGRRLPP